MKSQVTLKTIAKALNLSTSTVSRALADQWDVNSQTKKIVMELATQLNYKPNIMAVKLKQCHKNNPKVSKQPKITIKEMARQLNLAPSTISRALANKKHQEGCTSFSQEATLSPKSYRYHLKTTTY